MAYDFSFLPTHGSVDVSAQIYDDAGAPDPPENFQIISRAYETFETAGVPRAGVIQVELDNGMFGTSETGISDGVHTYVQGTCPPGKFYSKSYTAPFELGKPFSALAYIDEARTTNTEFFHFSTGGSVNFSLFEADGVTPVDFALAPASTPGVPINLAPEPGAFAMWAIIIVFGVSWRVRRRVLLPWKKQEPHSAFYQLLG